MSHKIKYFVFAFAITGLAVVSGAWMGLGADSTASAVGYNPVPTKPVAVVSLGDSRAAGLGLLPTSPIKQYDVPCGRSSQAAVNVMAKDMAITPYNYACQGATTKSILNSQVAEGVTVPSQYSQIPAALKLSTTSKIVTLFTGPNDVSWSDWLGKCIYSTCGTPEDTATLDYLINDVKVDMRNTLPHLTNMNTVVLVGGVYDPFLNNDQLAMAYGLSPEEIVWQRGMVTKLNAALSSVASEYVRQNVKFAPVSFTQMNEMQWPNQAPAPFHPTAVGQNTTAKQLEAAIRFVAMPIR